MASLRIATRGSRLAMWQTEHVAGLLRARRPELEIEIVRIKTSGDIIQDVPLSSVGSSAFFTKEIESALLSKEADIAVHSLKDLASTDVEGLTLGAVLEREDPRDALLSASGQLLKELPDGARVGTSSVRRQAVLRATRPELEILDLRGNVPTRVDKLDEGGYDAIILAVAGLKRLGMGHRITEYLDEDHFVPAAGQGAVAVQLRVGDEDALSAVAPLQDDATRARVDAERAFLREMGVGCQAPVGAHARLVGDELVVKALVVAVDGSRALEVSASGTPAEAEALGRALADEMRRAGGVALLEEARSWGERS